MKISLEHFRDDCLSRHSKELFSDEDIRLSFLIRGESVVGFAYVFLFSVFIRIVCFYSDLANISTDLFPLTLSSIIYVISAAGFWDYSKRVSRIVQFLYQGSILFGTFCSPGSTLFLAVDWMDVHFLNQKFSEYLVVSPVNPVVWLIFVAL